MVAFDFYATGKGDTQCMLSTTLLLDNDFNFSMFEGFLQKCKQVVDEIDFIPLEGSIRFAYTLLVELIYRTSVKGGEYSYSYNAKMLSVYEIMSQEPMGFDVDYEAVPILTPLYTLIGHNYQPTYGLLQKSLDRLENRKEEVDFNTLVYFDGHHKEYLRLAKEDRI